MGIEELKYNGKVITTKSDILKILKENSLNWLIDSETEDAIIEIVNKTLIWHSGIFKYGKWKYGIFKNGGFYGTWENGIWENGIFRGTWKTGLNKPI
jgi:hypothetical protein